MYGKEGNLYFSEIVYGIGTLIKIIGPLINFHTHLEGGVCDSQR